MTERKLWVIPLVWVLTVGAASTLTWTAISTAGAGVGRPVTVPMSTASGAQAAQASRSWSGRGGRLTAECTGSSIALGTAVPDDGYFVKVYDPGPRTLRVDFESTHPDDYAEGRIAATCHDGTPSFQRV